MTDEPEDRYFVVPWDTTGRLMTARKLKEHLTLAEAKAMQAEADRLGGMLLIYKETPPAKPPETA
jgi:hypothetical protein